LAPFAGVPLASTSLSISNDNCPLAMRALFDEIDSNKDGLVSEEELVEFTDKRHLPRSYVKEFMTGARAHTAARSARPGPVEALAGAMRRWGKRGAEGAGEELRRPGQDLRFVEFSRFVRAKEGALRESFHKIDTDQDGFISVDDLKKALGDVRVCSIDTTKSPSCLIRKALGLGKKPSTCRVKCSQVKCMIAAIDVRDGQSGKVLKHRQENACEFANTSSQMMDYSRFRDFFVLLPDTALLFDYWMDSTCTTFRGCDIGCSVQLSNKQNQMTGAMQALRHLAAGAVAGAVSRTTTAPVETLRLRMMVGGTSGGGLKHQLNGLLRDARLSGGKAFFAGNGANVARSAPQKGIDFFAFALYKSAFQRLWMSGLREEGPGHVEGMQTLTAGALAGATSCVALYPLELARSRLTTTGSYNGILDCLRKIKQAEGVKGLYTGLKPSVMGILPEAAIAYGCFDLLKQGYARMAGIPEKEVGAMPAMVCGMISAFTGQLVAYPLEVLARRMQVGGAVQKSAGVIPFAARIVRQEGLGSLYCGIVPASVKVLPMAAISFATYEMVSTLLGSQAEAMDPEKVDTEQEVPEDDSKLSSTAHPARLVAACARETGVERSSNPPCAV